MKKVNDWVRLVVVMCVLLSVMACGQTGDLYLPEGNALTSWLG